MDRTSAPARLAWPDLAKGLCILLVVLHHVTRYAVDHLPPELDLVGEVWFGLTTALKPIRMPLFFLVSGLFAARAIARPWADHRKRLVGGGYLYVVWLLVYWVVYSYETTLGANRTQGPADFVGELLWAATSMWFLYALVAYFVVAKLARRLPPLAVLAVATTISVTLSGWGIHEANRFSVLFHLTFFLVGAYYPRLVHATARSGWSLRTLLAAYVVGSLLLVWADPPRSVEILALSLVGVPLGVLAAVRLADVRAVSRPLTWLGRRTLPVYVLHMAVLAVLVHLPRPALTDPSTVALVALALSPLVVSVVVVAASLGLHAVLVRTGGGLLFNAPSVLTTGRAPVTPAAPAQAPATGPQAVTPPSSASRRAVA